MKRFKILFVFLLTVSSAFAQDDYPNSIVNIGVGGGPNYGVLGLKSVIGYRDCGLLLGVGTVNGMTAYEIGGQISSGWWFLNLGYGTYGTSENAPTGEKKLMNGGNLITGGMITFGHSRRLFLDLGIGVSWGAKSTNFLGQNVNLTTVSGILGLSYRFGGHIN